MKPNFFSTLFFIISFFPLILKMPDTQVWRVVTGCQEYNNRPTICSSEEYVEEKKMNDEKKENE